MRRKAFFIAAFLILASHFSIGAELKQTDSAEIVLDSGAIVKSICRDPRGSLWIGTEDHGVFRVSKRKNGGIAIRNFGVDDGLPESHCYALECDSRGRIWVGHQFSGVSVWNGKTWRSYDCLKGPLSGRIFAIRTNPANGDVWIATDAGISIYQEKSRRWKHLTRLNGLPEDQVNAVAFRKNGDAFLATQSAGIVQVSFRRKENGKQAMFLRRMRAPETTSPLPPSDRGEGLPSNLINDILVARDDSAIVAATTAGLTWSKDGGRTWRWISGANRKRKAALLEFPSAPSQSATDDSRERERLVPADFTTRLIELPGRNGTILVATRESGCAIFDLAAERISDPEDLFAMPKSFKGVMVGAFAAGSGRLFAGGHPGPTISIELPWRSPTEARPSQDALGLVPPFPVPDSPPDDRTLRETARIIRALPRMSDAEPSAVLLREDWATKGDWFGRYGRKCALLCAVASPRNHTVCWKGDEIAVMPWLASSAIKGKDRLRRWLHSENEDCNRNVLFDPVFGIRLQGSWDDHKEAYPLEFDGPDIFLQIDHSLRRGVYLVSFYFHNKDGERGRERWRDYVLEIKRPVGEKSKKGWRHRDPVRDDAALAATRVTDYRGGVYKTFLVNWPIDQPLYALLRANWSYNTELCAVMIDRLDIDPSGRELRNTPRLPFVVDCMPSFLRPWIAEKASPAVELREAAFSALQRAGGEKWHYPALRAACQAYGKCDMSKLPPQWRAELKCWLPEDRAEFDRLIDENRSWLKKNRPDFLKADRRTQEFRRKWGGGNRQFEPESDALE